MGLTGEDVGRRVVVRRIEPSAGSRPRFRDVLGELVRLDAASVVVRRADGELVAIPRGAVAAAKTVPPAPARRPSVRDLEEIARLGWRGLEEEWLGGWLLRAGDGFTGRANSVLPLERPDRPLAAALDTVSRWYAERGLPPLFQIPLPLAAELDRTLAEAGWRAYNPSHFLTAAVSDLLVHCPPRPDLPPVVHERTASPAWLAGYHYRGRPLPEGALSVLANAADPTFAAVYDGTRLLAVGRGVVDQGVDQGWLGVTAVTVAADARRQGLGVHLMRGLALWAQAAGAGHCYLQVAAENAPALAMYDRLGFVVHHCYHYRVLE